MVLGVVRTEFFLCQRGRRRHDPHELLPTAFRFSKDESELAAETLRVVRLDRGVLRGLAIGSADDASCG